MGGGRFFAERVPSFSGVHVCDAGVLCKGELFGDYGDGAAELLGVDGVRAFVPDREQEPKGLPQQDLLRFLGFSQDLDLFRG